MSIQLDKTNIAIRSRGLLELFDLALHVVRDHFLPLMMALLLGAVPWIIVNDLILSRFLTEEAWGPYVIFLAIMTAAQAQIGTVVITQYLGQVVFSKRPNVFHCYLESLKSWPRILVSQGFVRLAIPITTLMLLVNERSEDSIINFVILTGLMLFAAIVIRGIRTYVMEIIVLEKPARRSSGGISFAKRNQSLHKVVTGDLIIAYMLSVLIACSLALSFHALFIYRGLITNYWRFDGWTYLVFLPLAFWLSAGFLAVVRFLSYIDLRIRQEGWEVELKMKALAQRMEEGIH